MIETVAEFMTKCYIERKKYKMCVFLDLSKAFDTISHDMLLKN